MKAAAVAFDRGHQVTLFEKRKLGGFLHEASAPEFKADIRNALKYLTVQVEKRDIKVVEKRRLPLIWRALMPSSSPPVPLVSVCRFLALTGLMSSWRWKPWQRTVPVSLATSW